MCGLSRWCGLLHLFKCAVLHATFGLALAGCAMTVEPAQPVITVGSVTQAGALASSALAAWVGAPRRLSEAEREAVIAAAIAEHEMRRP